MLFVGLFAVVFSANALTYNVTVPAGTNECWIAGTMSNWNFWQMSRVDSTHYTIDISNAITSHEYKYCCGASWDLVETDAAGNFPNNRTWSVNDVVERWNSPTWNIGSPTSTSVTATFENGTLTISGTGNMQSWSEASMLPWYNSRGIITTLVINDGVTNIGNYAFSGFYGLTSVIIPNSVTSIGSYACRNCSQLPSVTIPNSVTSIGQYAFENCTSLTSVTIPNSVTSIGQCAFAGCTHLTAVNFNATNCTLMGNFSYPVFAGCNAFITLNIGSDVTNIPRYAFVYCNYLTTVNFNATNCSRMGDMSGTTVESVFDGCTALTTLNIGSNVTKIPSYAFYGCNKLRGTITIPNSVTSIGQYAFYGCNNSTSTINIGNSVNSVSTYAFYNCNRVTGTLNNSGIYGNEAHTEIICSLEFDAIGRLLGITFRQPSRNSAQRAPADTPATIGIKITSLSENTTYYYTMQMLSNETVLNAKEGEFTTTGESSINEVLANSIIIYPNPVTDELKIESVDCQINSVEIFDVSGRAVGAGRALPLHNGGQTINVSALPAGVYLIKINTDKGTKTERFIKK
jgi:hypothetical protein